MLTTVATISPCSTQSSQTDFEKSDIIAGHVQELLVGSSVPGLRHIKWEITSQLQVELSMQLEVIVVTNTCTFILLVLTYVITEHLYLNKDMSLGIVSLGRGH